MRHQALELVVLVPIGSVSACPTAAAPLSLSPFVERSFAGASLGTQRIKRRGELSLLANEFNMRLAEVRSLPDRLRACASITNGNFQLKTVRNWVYASIDSSDSDALNFQIWKAHG